MNDYVFSWAEDATGQMVHVDTVPNGLACGCHCPRCKEPLLARHGKVLAHGFAHHSEDRAANLEICYQVILYKLAEHIIKKLQHIHTPSYYGIYQEQDIYFADVKIDGQYEREDKQPDVVATAKDGTQYLIEFTFSHKVQHKQPVDYQNVNCLEIDLAGQTLESLEDFLLKSSDGRRWMNNEKYFNSIDGLYQKKGKAIRITHERTCSTCPIKSNCAGAARNGDILRIHNNGSVYRLCKTQEYATRLKKQQYEEAMRQAWKAHMYENYRRREKVDDWWHVETDEEIEALEKRREANRKEREEWKDTHSAPAGVRSCFNCQSNLSWMNRGGMANCGQAPSLRLPPRHSPTVAVNCPRYRPK